MEEEKTYIKGPGAVSVRGVVAGEEGCRQCPLQPRDCTKVNSSVAVWTNIDKKETQNTEIKILHWIKLNSNELKYRIDLS